VPDRIVACHACATAHRFEDVVPRRADCERCGSALHCCRNCTFYDPAAHNACRESSAERVVEKDTSNFCDFFRPVSAAGAAAASGAPGASAGAPLDALEKLFKKS
jgi:hypothetical protein